MEKHCRCWSSINSSKLFAGLIFLLFISTLVLNNRYGPLFSAKITGREQMYVIGQMCSASRVECEKIYFGDHLDKINLLKNKNREYFSNILIEYDRVGYTGNCPCPYDRDVRNYSCGGRSSYSKGGQISYCYDQDVSDTQVELQKAYMIDNVYRNLNTAVQKNVKVYDGHHTFVIIGLFYIGLIIYFRKKLLL